MLKDIKISTQVIIGLVFAMVVTLVVGIVGRQALATGTANMHDLAETRIPGAEALHFISSGQLRIAAGIRGLHQGGRATDQKSRQYNYDEITVGARDAVDGKRTYEGVPKTPEEARLWQQFAPQIDDYQHRIQGIVDTNREKDALLAQGRKLDDPAILQLDERAVQAQLSAREVRIESTRILDELVRLNRDTARSAAKDATAAAESSLNQIAAFLLAGLLGLAAVTLIVVHSINRPLAALRSEANRLTEAAVAGQLSTRGDVTAVPTEFRPIVQGVNDTLDAVIGPLNVAADYVDKISKGNIPAKITDSYNGDFNTIKNNLNQCIDAVNGIITDAVVLAKAAVEGKLSTRGDASKHHGDFRKIVQGVNDTLDSVIGPLNVAADYVDKISKGNIPAKITDSYNGDFNTIKNNLNQCIDAVNNLIADAASLSKAAVEGKLATRADVSKHHGDFRKIVQGVNDTLDSVIGPLNVAADYVDKISKGNIPNKIADNYSGDFNTIKNNLNQCIDAVGMLVSDAQALSLAAVEGRLSTRADATRHAGDFRKIVEGVNSTLDAVINPITEAAQVLESLSNYDLRVRVQGNYNGDHARIKTALNSTGKALHDALTHVADAVEQLSQASQQIASSSQQVAQGASEQASSLEETSSSLEEMSGMTKQNADNTIQARTLAQTTKEAAEKGGLAMTRMMDAMEKIRAASEGTSQIIKDINEIAFQTNLLALNAAVEAARAGDAGRGFAVVAEEVRSLALRSKEAAKKTEDLIKMSVGHAENGRVISAEVAGSLNEIVTAAGKVNDIVSEIAVASQETSRGIEQVNTAVSEMDKVVQVAAANAEESSSAAEELSSQSEELNELVGRFQLDRDVAKRGVRRDAVTADARRRSVAAAPIRRTPQAGPPRVRNSGANGTRKPTAEEIIPFESDPDFKDF
jgi:methyl-accepting chemotaxis protein